MRCHQLVPKPSCECQRACQRHPPSFLPCPLCRSPVWYQCHCCQGGTYKGLWVMSHALRFMQRACWPRRTPAAWPCARSSGRRPPPPPRSARRPRHVTRWRWRCATSPCSPPLPAHTQIQRCCQCPPLPLSVMPPRDPSHGSGQDRWLMWARKLATPPVSHHSQTLP